MDYRILGNTGLRLSILGFGAAPLGDEYGRVDPPEATRTVHEAIDRGINFFDTSPYYGRTLSEQRLGEALEGKRSEVILCSKCGRYDKDVFDFSAERVKRSIDESLTRLRTDYLDLFIAHDIEFGDPEQVIAETLPALREIQQAGKARYIGISGLPLALLADVAQRGKVDFVLSYCHYDLLAQDLDQVLAPVARATGMGLINASPLHMGLLSREGAPAWHPAPDDIKKVAAQIARFCESQGVEVSTLAVRYSLDYPAVASTLVGMINRKELDRNLKAFDFKADPELIAQIEAIAKPVLNKTWPSGRAAAN